MRDLFIIIYSSWAVKMTQLLTIHFISTSAILILEWKYQLALPTVWAYIVFIVKSFICFRLLIIKPLVIRIKTMNYIYLSLSLSIN